MEKESFNIDDILSEARKRREEMQNEIELTQAEAPEEAIVETEETVFDQVVIGGEEPVVEEEPDVELTLSENDLQPEEAVENTADEIAEEPTIIMDKVEEPAEEPQIDEVEDEPIVVDNQINNQDENMVDLLSLAVEPEAVEEIVEEAEAPVEALTAKDNKNSKNKKAIKIIIIVLVALIVIAGVLGVLYANNLLNKVTKDVADPYEMTTYYDGMDFLQEEFPTIDEVDASQVASYKEYLKNWYQNGDPVSSTHVLNILLIGEDTREDKISSASRADSAIIASINIDTQEITLTSILRDLYVYYEVDGVGQYGKINESAANGGMETYIKTLERYYKIAINNYAVVNFASFPKIIDSLGGVDIKITSREINEINNHPKRYNKVTIEQTFDGDEGTMTLTGEQALAYCRIRKIDSDGQRANRQKIVLQKLFNKARKSGTIDTVKLVDKLVNYVYTGYEKSELVSIGNTALKDGWLNYEVKTTNVPATENCKGGQKFSAAPGNWIWLADIPKDAYELQMLIYGKSNIKLNENRADYIAVGK